MAEAFIFTSFESFHAMLPCSERKVYVEDSWNKANEAEETKMLNWHQKARYFYGELLYCLYSGDRWASVVFWINFCSQCSGGDCSSTS